MYTVAFFFLQTQDKTNSTKFIQTKEGKAFCTKRDRLIMILWKTLECLQAEYIVLSISLQCLNIFNSSYVGERVCVGERETSLCQAPGAWPSPLTPLITGSSGRVIHHGCQRKDAKGWVCVCMRMRETVLACVCLELCGCWCLQAIMSVGVSSLTDSELEAGRQK